MIENSYIYQNPKINNWNYFFFILARYAKHFFFWTILSILFSNLLYQVSHFCAMLFELIITVVVASFLFLVFSHGKVPWTLCDFFCNHDWCPSLNLNLRIAHFSIKIRSFLNVYPQLQIFTSLATTWANPSMQRHQQTNKPISSENIIWTFTFLSHLIMFTESAKSCFDKLAREKSVWSVSLAYSLFDQMSSALSQNATFHRHNGSFRHAPLCAL